MYQNVMQRLDGPQRFAFNIFLKAGMIVLLNYVGLFTLMKDGHVATGPKEIIITACAGALIFCLVGVVIALFTFNLIALLYVFFGGLVLYVMSQVAPGFIALHGFWVTVLAGFLVGVTYLPTSKRQ